MEVLYLSMIVAVTVILIVFIALHGVQSADRPAAIREVGKLLTLLFGGGRRQEP
jgi:hypothetical protein